MTLDQLLALYAGPPPLTTSGYASIWDADDRLLGRSAALTVIIHRGVMRAEQPVIVTACADGLVARGLLSLPQLLAKPVLLTLPAVHAVRSGLTYELAPPRGVLVEFSTRG